MTVFAAAPLQDPGGDWRRELPVWVVLDLDSRKLGGWRARYGWHERVGDVVDVFLSSALPGALPAILTVWKEGA